MKRLLLITLMALGAVSAFSQMTIKTKFKFEGVEDIVMKWEFSNSYENVRISLIIDGVYEKGDLLDVTNVVIEDGCAMFDILGADGTFFSIAKCKDGSFAYDNGVKLLSAYYVRSWDNGL